MTFATKPLHPDFGVAIDPGDTSGEWNEETALELKNAVEQSGVALLRNQDFDGDKLGKLAELMGEIWSPQSVTSTYGRIAGSKTFRLTNLDPEGKILPVTSKIISFNKANELWHTDATYVRPGSSVSLLYSIVVPPEAGETEFCDTRLAYDRLSDQDKTLAEGLIANHTLLQSRALSGFDDWTEDERSAFTRIARPLVHVHKPTGRKALCLASHIATFEGWNYLATQDFVERLTYLATQSGSVYKHRWQAGDLLLWDNRCTMHRARPYDPSYARDMCSVRLVDENDVV
ncbi:TauD/TfdA family dioxygenase [Tsuneonella sp. CC-YZS046]|uniref:TauD/TfdA dioxygenase family protein n=1 Tax=Tsuneonella sp. CC-YZS046 TaxID=3042152 RepID=UPI002D764F16|nr:TauD/TfdA family dioxygenase [Tsuneonella sp. CC-YZS046]WRO66661.1 TauD/TfdA family dioxygenase [Tsuneonella sp. CC-YZS046]